MPIWTYKIFPAIDFCVALIILWTSKAIVKPDVILKEVEYAKKIGKRIVLLAEAGIGIPELFPRDNEYVRIPLNITETELIKLVSDIEKAYRSGGYG